MIYTFNNGKLSYRAGLGKTYDGEKLPGDLSGWDELSNDSNKFLINNYDLLSRRSTTLYHTYPPVRAAINKQVDYSIGKGLIFRSQPSWSNIPGMDKKSGKDWGKDFQKIVDYYFRTFSFYQKQGLLMRGAMVEGDSLLYFLYKDGYLQDLVEAQGNNIDSKSTANSTDLGIIHDEYLRQLGIITTSGKSVLYQENGIRNLVRFYTKELPRQLRGYPLAYSIINYAKNDDRFHDAIVQRAVLESILIGNVESDGVDFGRQTQNMAAANKAKKLGISGIKNIISRIGNAKQLGAGNIFEGRRGDKLTFTEMKAPGNNFDTFNTWSINYTSMATGTPPEVMLSKYGTSYTAHRGAINDFIQRCSANRGGFVNYVGNPVIIEILKDAVVRGYIKAPGILGNPMLLDAYTRGNFLGPIPGSINPLQESNANKKNVEMGAVLRGDIAARNGNEWDDFIEEYAEQEEEWVKASAEYKTKLFIEEEKKNG